VTGEATRGPEWAWHPPTGMLSSGKVSSLCTNLNSILGSFDIEKVCSLVEKYYPADFSNQERMQLECQLPHFQLDVCNHPELKGLSSLADLTSGLVKLDKDSSYPMVDKLLRLLLTLPVSTATIERAFSAMKFVKTCLRSKMGDVYLRSKMGDVYLRDYLVVYIERELAVMISSDDIIKVYDLANTHRTKFKITEIKF
jgi:hypothetical protein